MKLTYQTATATIIQFIVLGMLNIANAVESVAKTCGHDGSNCISNLLTSSIFYIVIMVWFGLIVIVGYGAQLRRSKRLAQLLIAAELAILLVATFNIKLSLKYHNGLLSLATSVIDVVLALWVISLAYRLMKSGGGRIIAAQHSRRRPKPQA